MTQLNAAAGSCVCSVDVPAGGDGPDAAQAERLRALVLDVTRLLNEVDRIESECCGVTVGQCMTLTTLYDGGPLTGQQLGQAMGLAPSTVTRALAPLERQGWIGRERDQADRRQVWISLTPEGTALAAQLSARGNAIYRLILSRVPADERERTLEALELLVGACREAQALCGPAEATTQPAAPTAANLETAHV